MAQIQSYYDRAASRASSEIFSRAGGRESGPAYRFLGCLSITIALCAQAQPVATFPGADTPRTLSDEASRQKDIYQSAGQKVPEGYVVGRSLLSYTVTLSPEFRESLAKLGPRDRWLDIGAGEGNAILDYRSSKYDVILQGFGESGGKAQAVAMSIEDRRTARWGAVAESLGDRQIQYLSGRRLREYSPQELGQFQLLTDVLGAFSYTRYLSIFMERALGVLALNGSFYTVLQDVGSENGTNKPFYAEAPFLTEIVTSDSSEVKVCTWLKSIGCVEVTCDFNPDSSPPVERYRIHKVCDATTVPQLELIHFTAGTPPERRFRLRSPLREARDAAEVTR